MPPKKAISVDCTHPNKDNVQYYNSEFSGVYFLLLLLLLLEIIFLSFMNLYFKIKYINKHTFKQFSSLY
jgi:hypothetical protein